MPELPEVEVTRRGVAPHIEGRIVEQVLLRREGLRWPFPPRLAELLQGQRITHTGRRGKYLLIGFAHGTLIVHLGMSGHLRVLPAATAAKKHDHIDLVVSGDAGPQALRMHDPRRFGAVLWHGNAEGDIGQHILLRALGGTARSGLHRRPAAQGHAGALGAHQAGAAGRRHRGRRGQYLRLRKPVSRRDQSENRGRAHQPWPL